MRLLSLLVLLAISVAVVSSSVCPAISSELAVKKQNNLENTYTLQFNSRDETPLEWVELHWSINGVNAVNVRMTNHLGSSHTIEQDGIVLKSNDLLRYFATYTTKDGITCNTEAQTYTAQEHTENQLNHEFNEHLNDNRIRSEQRNEMEIHAINRNTHQNTPLSSSPSSSHPACPSLEFTQKVEKSSTTDNRYSIVFESSQPIDSVELHYKLEKEQRNVKLNGAHTNRAELGNLEMKDGQKLNYWFTYVVNGVACDTAMFAVQAGNFIDNQHEQTQSQALHSPHEQSYQQQFNQPIQHLNNNRNQVQSQLMNSASNELLHNVCPSVPFQQAISSMSSHPELYQISFINPDSSSQLEFVDLHFQVNAEPEMNIRLGMNSNEFHQPNLHLESNDVINYYFTYKVKNRPACDTIKYQAQA